MMDNEDIERKPFTEEEIMYVVKACRNMPKKELDEKIVDTLEPKLRHMLRMHRVGDAFNLLGE